MIATILFYFAVDSLPSKKLIDLNAILIGVLGATALWFSHPAVFVLAGIGVSKILFNLIKKDWVKIGQLSIICSFWALSFITFYLVSLNDLNRNQYLLDFWSDSFLPFPPGSLSDIKWYLNTLLIIFEQPIGLGSSGIAIFAFLVGSIIIFSQKKIIFFILILPILFTLLTSGLKLYPFRGRLLLFITPILLIFIAEGAEEIRVKTRATSATTGIAFLCLMFSLSLINTTNSLIRPQSTEEIKPVINYIKKHEQSGDVLYLYYGSIHQYKYYAKKFNLSNSYIEGVRSRQNWTNYVSDINKLRGNKRVWILFSHVYTLEGIDEEKFFLYNLNNIGTELENFKSTGASVYLYNLSY